MKLWHGWMGIYLFAAAGVAMSIFSSCTTLTRTVLVPPEVEGATYVGNKVCAECHTNYTRMFPASPHARVFFENSKMAGFNGCESCHGPGSKHSQGGGGRGKFIVNPGKDPSTCFQCHIDIQAEFHFPQHHPVVEGQMNCVQCHDPHGRDIFKPAGGLAMARGNQICATCHREQTRHFIFEHEAIREGCTVCHKPHGSVSAKMLVERDPNLCLKCHAQIQGQSVGSGDIYIGKIPHSAYLRMGTCWSAGCHTAVHGSNMSRQLLY